MHRQGKICAPDTHMVTTSLALAEPLQCLIHKKVRLHGCQSHNSCKGVLKGIDCSTALLLFVHLMQSPGIDVVPS